MHQHAFQKGLVYMSHALKQISTLYVSVTHKASLATYMPSPLFWQKSWQLGRSDLIYSHRGIQTIIITNRLPTRLRTFHSNGLPRCPAGFVDALASRPVVGGMNHPKWPFTHRTLQLAAIKDGMASRREPLQRFHGASSHDGPKQARVNFSGL